MANLSYANMYFLFTCRTVQEVLAGLELLLSDDGANIVNVDREDVLEGATIAFTSPRFDPTKKLDVTFGDEDGIDTGGPSRECLRLLMEEVKSLGIFHGSDHAKNLQLDGCGK